MTGRDIDCFQGFRLPAAGSVMIHEHFTGLEVQVLHMPRKVCPGQAAGSKIVPDRIRFRHLFQEVVSHRSRQPHEDPGKIQPSDRLLRQAADIAAAPCRSKDIPNDNPVDPPLQTPFRAFQMLKIKGLERIDHQIGEDHIGDLRAFENQRSPGILRINHRHQRNTDHGIADHAAGKDAIADGAVALIAEPDAAGTALEIAVGNGDIFAGMIVTEFKNITFDGNGVISGGDGAAADPHVGAAVDIQSVGIGTLQGRIDRDTGYRDPFAAQQPNRIAGRIKNRHAGNRDILTAAKMDQSLRTMQLRPPALSENRILLRRINPPEVIGSAAVDYAEPGDGGMADIDAAEQITVAVAGRLDGFALRIRDRQQRAAQFRSGRKIQFDMIAQGRHAKMMNSRRNKDRAAAGSGGTVDRGLKIREIGD
ncbi:hypothetical protein SDC9_89601 [bioreactor metagenome]|uniref:Uncharacterized protein n=1 Tax=bioreactor metagenome TaxID=1076179 RepID=A0A644ZPN3_9ZZZZ